MKKTFLSILRYFIAACAMAAVAAAASAAGTDAARMITADYSKQCSGECIPFIADSSESSVKILFTAREAVSDFSFLSVEFKDFVNGRPVFGTSPLKTLKTLEPERPLLVTMTFFGDLPSYGISFTDKNGEVHLISDRSFNKEELIVPDDIKKCYILTWCFVMRE